jgi:prolyl-tRNA synthetase
VEFMVRSEAGEDRVAVCTECGYAANLETARSVLPTVDDPTDDAAVERFDTPGVRTIADLAAFDGGAPADRQIKTLVQVVDDEPVLVLLRGDHDLQEQKLADALGVAEVRPAGDDEIVELLGAHPGSLGAVGVDHVKVVADEHLRDRTHMTTGANEDDVHVRGVDVGRDIAVSAWMDLREVRAGEACPTCGSALGIDRTIEIGHIFKLGRTYTKAFDVSVADADGGSVVPIMGSYGIGVERNLAVAVEVHHDDHGIVWPVPLAPWEVVVTVVRPDDEATAAAADRIEAELEGRGIEVLVDDRDERPGVKFADAELIGIPVRVTVGPRGLANGQVEVTERASGEREDVGLDEVVGLVAERIMGARQGR